VREALIWSAVWIILALLFNLGIYWLRGTETALQFLAGYLIEKSLSVDNLFVFLLIFTYFKVPKLYQHKILFWGIIGALVMRAVFIMTGVALIRHFFWVSYLFGIFLIFTGFKLAFGEEKEIKEEKSLVLRLFRKVMSVSSSSEGGRFFAIEEGKRVATPLFVVLLVVESTDLVFAIDSIPAILAISKDPFIVYSSNVFAILGLRALYFALAGIMQMFHYLHYGLAMILAFVGVKMLLEDLFHIPVGIALGFIAAVLTISILLSLKFPKKVKIEGITADPHQ
ncbi:MAG: TerC family protein, partial [Deltaproteobacteria bacterium]|nr:TerC family protein [Deltaproteobacteria bacterium]